MKKKFFVIHFVKANRFLVDVPPTGFRSTIVRSKATRFETPEAARQYCITRGVHAYDIAVWPLTTRNVLLFMHVQDFVDAYVGPFDSMKALQTHYAWCRNVRGDGAELLEVVSEVPANTGALVMTADEDRKEVV